MNKQDKIELLNQAVQLCDTGLSSIAGMATACINEDELSDWQAKSILRCILATATHYGILNQELMEKTDD